MEKSNDAPMTETLMEVDGEVSGTTTPKGNLIHIGTPNHDTPSLTPESSSSNETSLTPWLPNLSAAYCDDLPVLSAEGLWRVSRDLEDAGKTAWSRMPRIYSICYALGKLGLMEAFCAEGYSDAGAPFSSDDLREVLPDLRPRTLFFESQRMALSSPHRPETFWGGHQHFYCADVPFAHVRALGHSDVVESALTRHQYVRKRIVRRGQHLTARTWLFNYVENIEALKKLAHRHIATFVCSYSDEHSIAILTQPVPDCSLESFLSQDPYPGWAQKLLQSSFGCLAGALQYLCGEGMTFKSIRPSNILIKGRSMLFTDLVVPSGCQRFRNNRKRNDFSTMISHKYCAPEEEEEEEDEDEEEPRHTSHNLSDIWALGCVFLEMWTVIHGRSIEQLSVFLLENGSSNLQYCKNIDAGEMWLEGLQKSPLPTGLGEAGDTSNGPYIWIKGMLMRDRALRTRDTASLLRAICQAGTVYTSQCCFNQNSALFSKAASARHRK